MDHFYDPNNQKIHKPMFDVIEPSIVRAQFSSKREVSFSSYLHQSSNNHQKKFVMPQNRTEDSDQISIFDAAKYFSSGLHDDDDDEKKEQPLKGVIKVNNNHHLASTIPPRLSSVSSSVDDSGSNCGGRSSTCASGNNNNNNYNNNYRARSFHATPTASSEASWNSQTGLLANPPGSIGVSIAKTLSPNSSSSTTSNVTAPRWPRISAKWLIPRRKCPCSGKKSVQVEEKIESTTPRMVDLRRSTSSNGSAANYISSSWHSPRQKCHKNLGSTLPLTSTTPNVVSVTPQELGNNSNFSHSVKIPNVTNHVHSIPKAVGPLNSYANHSEITGTTVTTAAATATAAVTATSSSTTSATNGFTFPILENSPLGVKKMFTVISDPPRDSLEVFQPRSHPSPTSRRTSYDDDNVLSDGSSDLFEIDSFSTTYNPCRDSLDDEVVIPASNFNSSTMKRLGIVCRSNNINNINNNNNSNNNNNNSSNVNNVDENDGLHEPVTPSVAHTECYAPSEVSIDWSVTTAEGFDRASLTNFSVSASEAGQYAAMRRESERNNGGGRGEEKRSGGGGGSSRQSSGKGSGSTNVGGGLLSCRCEKAVSVGPGPIKCSAEGGPPIAARHVSGRPTQQPHHGVAAHVNGRWK